MPFSPISKSSRQNHFATTHWSLILQAADKEDSCVAKKALAELCQQYWYPLYCFVRSRVQSPEDSADIVQSFFVQLLEKESIRMADQARGRFRSFLLASIDNFTKNWHRAATAQKRGGDAQHVSIDFELADRRFQQEPSDLLTPEKMFERSWALGLIEGCLQSLRQRYENTGKAKLFEALSRSLIGGSIRYADIAAELGINENAVKVAAHRMRQRLGDEIRIEIANTLGQGEDVDSELRQLMNAIQT